MVYIRRGRERHLQKAVAVVGPVTVAVDSRQSSFQVVDPQIHTSHIKLSNGGGGGGGGQLQMPLFDLWVRSNPIAKPIHMYS